MDETGPVRMVATVRGRVHGVGFRVSAADQARRLRLVGSVANLADGAVRVVAEGPGGAVDRLAGWLWEGPPAARVTGVEVTREDPHHEDSSFVILPTR